MRKIRTVASLLEYLESINCPMSRSTVNKLIKTSQIPYTRIGDRVIIFDLDVIDEWLGTGVVKDNGIVLVDE